MSLRFAAATAPAVVAITAMPRGTRASAVGSVDTARTRSLRDAAAPLCLYCEADDFQGELYVPQIQ